MLIDRGAHHIVLAGRVIVEWSTLVPADAEHPLLDDAQIRAVTTRPGGAPRVLDFTGWALRLPARGASRARLLGFGTNPRLLPSLAHSPLTGRGRAARARVRRPLLDAETALP